MTSQWQNVPFSVDLCWVASKRKQNNNDMVKRAKDLTHKALWNGSSPRKIMLLVVKKDGVTSTALSMGAQNQVRKMGPTPDKNGGELTALPN